MNIYENWTRKPELDTPRLVSGCNGYVDLDAENNAGLDSPVNNTMKVYRLKEM